MILCTFSALIMSLKGSVSLPVLLTFIAPDHENFIWGVSLANSLVFVEVKSTMNKFLKLN